ncbi:glutathione S-transferase family protein [Sphingomonas flavalba]|uniref:glutathione S-transferase family protein n=1 Tax=Sphingomonas flavalba TaxID=2559804 RepID=UPI0039DFC489
MADELILYTNPMSRGRIARWMLEEVGAPYRAEILDYASTMKQAPYLAINPMGKVPALVHGATVVTECAAICAYLADAFPDAGLAPPPAARGAYYRWLFFTAGPVEQAVTNHALKFDPTAEQGRLAGYGNYELAMDVLEQAITAAPYIAGDRFSAADVYVGAQVMWGVQFGTMPKRDAFVAYAARLAERPAHLRASALDDAAMAG